MVEEPGRQIVREEQATGGDALPWVDPVAFAEKAIEKSVAAFDEAADTTGPCFFDRSFIDAISYLAHFEGRVRPEHERLLHERRYASTVFLVPPWREIFQNDAERQTSFEKAVEEYKRLAVSFVEFGYEPVVLPKLSVADRIGDLLERIDR